MFFVSRLNTWWSIWNWSKMGLYITDVARSRTLVHFEEKYEIYIYIYKCLFFSSLPTFVGYHTFTPSNSDNTRAMGQKLPLCIQYSMAYEAYDTCTWKRTRIQTMNQNTSKPSVAFQANTHNKIRLCTTVGGWLSNNIGRANPVSQIECKTNLSKCKPLNCAEHAIYTFSTPLPRWLGSASWYWQTAELDSCGSGGRRA